MLQKTADIGEGRPDRDTMLQHFADENEIIGLFIGAALLDLLIEELDVGLIQVKRERAAQNERLIIEQVQMIDRVAKVLQIGVPPLFLLWCTAPHGLKESIRRLLPQQCLKGAKRLQTAALSAVAYFPLGLDLHMLKQCAVPVLSRADLLVQKEGAAQVLPQGEVDGIGQFRNDP